MIDDPFETARAFGMHAHSTVEEIVAVCGREFFERCFSFALVRHPVERVASMYRFVGRLLQGTGCERERCAGVSWRRGRSAVAVPELGGDPGLRGKRRLQRLHPLHRAQSRIFVPQVAQLRTGDGESGVDLAIRLDQVEAMLPALRERLRAAAGTAASEPRAGGGRRGGAEPRDRALIRGACAYYYEAFGIDDHAGEGVQPGSYLQCRAPSRGGRSRAAASSAPSARRGRRRRRAARRGALRRAAVRPRRSVAGRRRAPPARGRELGVAPRRHCLACSGFSFGHEERRRPGEQVLVEAVVAGGADGEVEGGEVGGDREATQLSDVAGSSGRVKAEVIQSALTRRGPARGEPRHSVIARAREVEIVARAQLQEYREAEPRASPSAARARRGRDASPSRE